jgi:hypothetical protein
LGRFGLAHDGKAAKLNLMKSILPFALAAALLTGCAAIERADHNATEQLLTAAGFKVLPANTPDRQAKMAELKPYTIARQIRGNNVYYIYPDDQNNFVLVGDQAAYSKYQSLLVQQQISNQNLMAAQMETMPGMWGGWGYYGY